MLRSIRKQISYIIFPDHEMEANKRVADIILQMDPYSPLMKKFNGAFSGKFNHPEDKLDARSQLLLKTLGYQLRDDPSFKYLTEWVMNTEGNAMLRAPARTNEERGEILMWGKAQISAITLFVEELGRLGSLYEELLESQKKEVGFNSENPVE